MDYVIRLVQVHESFRRPELEALSTLADLPHEVLSYNGDSPFCTVRFPTLVPSQHRASCSSSDDGHDPAIDTRVRDFESRSILSKSIYELWGQGNDYEELHEDVKRRSQHLWETFHLKSFKFSIDCYGSTRTMSQQREIINSFRYLDLKGKIQMKDPEAEFAVLEEWLPVALRSDGDGQERYQARAAPSTRLRAQV